MYSRRDFTKAVGTAALANALFQRKSNAGPTMAAITGAIRRDETIVRMSGNGEIFPMTWTADDRQFCSFSDGFGFSDSPSKSFNTRGVWVDGRPANARVRDIRSYPRLSPYFDKNFQDSAYYGFGCLAVQRAIYHFLSSNQSPGTVGAGWGWNGVKLVYSPDGGQTWHNQNGSTPVVWEPYAERSRKTLLFFEEPGESFSLVSILQMGRNYTANCDGYVYGYGPNGNVDGRMNQLVMFRVHKDKILDRGDYEFFGALHSSGDPIWVKDIEQRGVVHTFPAGWVNTPHNEDENVVQAWLPTIVYNAPLGLYLMANSGVGCLSDGDWSAKSKPSYLGFWTAPNPWGPWSQVAAETAWMPGNDSAARCYSPQIPPKWISPDGKSFWLVWTDYQIKCDDRDFEKIDQTTQHIKDPHEKARFHARSWRRCMPYYTLNAQRVDLMVSNI